MFDYAECMERDGNVHLGVPYYLECAIRGLSLGMDHLMENCYQHLVLETYRLGNFWTKIRIELELEPPFSDDAQNRRKERRDEVRSECTFCGKNDLPEHHLCAGCRCCSFCSKECQRNHWKSRNHRGECRQLKILKHHYRKYAAKEIRAAITGGTDPKTIEQLQIVRTELGLNRPEDEYKDLIQILEDDATKDRTKKQNRYLYLSGQPTDGTVFIGSTPNTI